MRSRPVLTRGITAKGREVLRRVLAAVDAELKRDGDGVVTVKTKGLK